MVLEHFTLHTAKRDDSVTSAAVSKSLQALEDDITLLGQLLDQCLEIEIGSELFVKYDRIRTLAEASSKLAAAQDPETGCMLSDRLAKELTDMPLSEALPVVRAFGHYLNLTSIAELHHSVRSTRSSASKVQTSDDVYLHLQEQGTTPEALYDAVVKQRVEIVLTAHPTQVNRRTLQHKLTRIAHLLAERDRGALTDEEQARIVEDLRREVAALWQTDELRRRKPTPLDEARGGLHIVEQSLWAAVPEVLRGVDRALRKHTGRELPIDAAPLHFGSWMGGDRDGNPNVTSKVTHDVACLARWMAADLYLREIDALRFELSMGHASDQLWRMARDIAAKHAEMDVANATAHQQSTSSSSAIKNPIVPELMMSAPTGDVSLAPGMFTGLSSLPGESPPDSAGGSRRALLRGESFAMRPERLAELLRQGANLDGMMSPPSIGSPTASFDWSSQGQDAAGMALGNPPAAISTASTTTTMNAAAQLNAAYNGGANNGIEKLGSECFEGSKSGRTSTDLKRADTSTSSFTGMPVNPERLKQRGNQAARYHKSSIDNLLHPRAAGAAPYRVVLGEVRAKLVATRRRMEDLLAGQPADEDSEWFESEPELLEPLLACYWSLWECGGGVIADGRLLDVIRRVHCFGLSLMKLDVRQESSRHTETLDEVTKHLGLGSYAEWDEERRVVWLVDELEGRRPLIPPAMPFTDDSQEVMDTFKVAAQLGRGSLGAYVISMATRASDVLAVELLQREAWLLTSRAEGIVRDWRPLRVVPLFETLSDLDASADVMTRLLGLPWYRKHVDGMHKGHQEVMLGYSDSGKDAGRLAAAWALYRCQERLVEVCAAAGVPLTLFHGRGGTVGRGGGPTLTAIQSQPPGSVQGSLRITEQGEMVQNKFGVSACARHQLEIYHNAVLLATLDPPPSPKAASWRQLMDEMSRLSCDAYRSVVFEDPLFIRYFAHATPQDELANLNIGSRPTRRKAGADVTTLRAIPWIFSWTQTRLVLPAWLGVGEALATAMQNGHKGALRDMYEHWPFFQSTIDLLELVCLKVELRVAALYEQHLVSDPEERAMGEALRRRYLQTVQTLQSITGHAKLVEHNPTLRRLVAMRNPGLDPLNVMQVEILRRLRGDPENQSLRDALLLTINGIAAGMRNTG